MEITAVYVFLFKNISQGLQQSFWTLLGVNPTKVKCKKVFVEYSALNFGLEGALITQPQYTKRGVEFTVEQVLR